MKTLFVAQAHARQGHWWRLPVFAAFLLVVNAGVALGQMTLITVLANSNVGGITEPSGSADYPIGTQIEISARANAGWVFTGWSDGNPYDARIIIVTEMPATYTANFVQLNRGLPSLVLRADQLELDQRFKNRELCLAALLPTARETALAIRAEGAVELTLALRMKGGAG